MTDLKTVTDLEAVTDIKTVQSRHSLVETTLQPQPTLTLTDAIAIPTMIVIGAGIFETPALVAANSGSAVGVILVWLIGGLVSLIGALCDAELATTYPPVSGNYEYRNGSSVLVLFSVERNSALLTEKKRFSAILRSFAKRIATVSSSVLPSNTASILRRL